MATSLRNITNQQILEFLVMLGGCLFAMYAGNYIAEENYFPIAAVLGMLAAGTFFFKMGTEMYLMIPVCWGLTGSISLLPLPFNVRQLMILMATVLFVAGYIFKVGKRYKYTYEIIDFWIWINLFYLFTAFLRNPVGFAAIGLGGRVCGKPYLILSRFRMPPSFAKRLPMIMVWVAAFTTFAGGIGLFFPGVGNILGKFYSDFLSYDFSGMSDPTSIKAGDTRFGFLGGLGMTIPLYIASRVNPVKLILPANLGWMLLYVASIIMVLLSGFRSGVIEVLLITIVGAMLREKMGGGVKIILAVCCVALAGVLTSYTSIKLPFTFQRSLCFLPGNWDAEAKLDAKDSSEWRFEMWRIVLTSDKYIQSKIFGDGFGFSREEYERCLNAMMSGTQAYQGADAAQEAFMIDGDFHSGPVGSIRFVGVVGLILFIPLLIMQGVYFYRLINEARGSPYELLSYYLGISAIILPIFFIFIVGDYRKDLVNILFNVGMIKMIGLSLRDWNASQQSDKTFGSELPVALSV